MDWSPEKTRVNSWNEWDQLHHINAGRAATSPTTACAFGVACIVVPLTCIEKESAKITSQNNRTTP